MRKIILPGVLAACTLCFAMTSNAQWTLTGNANGTATSILGTTNAIPLNLTTNNVQRLVIDANGKIGIGTATPINILTVKGAGSTPAASWVAAGAPLFVGFGETAVGNADYILAMASTSNNGRPVFVGRRSRGTLAAPTVMANNDFIMSMLASGYDGTAFQNPATIDFFVDGTPTTGSVPARISFVTGSNSSNRAERLKVGSTGDFTFNNNQLFLQQSTGFLGIGTVTPAAQLQLGNTVVNRKIVLFDIANNNNNQFYGFGVNNSTLRYQVDATSASHVFYAGTGTTTSSELMRIQGNGNVGIGTATPAAKMDVSGDALINGLTVGKGGGGIGNNTAMGNSALLSNTTGSQNTAVGFATLYYNTLGSDNTAVGYRTLNSNTNGFKNTAIGNASLYTNSTGSENTAIGFTSLGSNTSGYQNTAIGDASLFSNSDGYENTAVGDVSLYSNTSGFENTAIGNASLYSNSTGIQNNAIGSQSLYANTTGGLNSASGFQSLYANTTGSSNTAHGNQSLYTNLTGESNAAIGNQSLYNNNTGSFNLAIGAQAMYANTTGYFNTANGFASMNQNTTGDRNTATGSFSLKNNTEGTRNVAYGVDALFTNTTGSGNVANGFEALHNNTTGDANVALGKGALYSNTTQRNLVAIGDSALFNQNGSVGYYNVALGSKALFTNITGYGNTGVGNLSLFANKGDANTALGGLALNANSSGNRNTATGYYSMISNTGGSYNTANGMFALYSNTTGSFNTAIGYNVNVTTGNFSNATGLGFAASIDSSNKVRIGNTSVASIGGQVGWTNYSDGRIKQNIRENVPGLSFINLLKPVTYNFNLAKENELMGLKDTLQWEGKNDIEKINFTGFVAQDVEAAAKKVEYDFSGVDKRGRVMGLRYAEFVVPLVKAVQELSKKNDEVDELKTQLANQQQQINELKDAIIKLVNQQKCVPTTGK